MLGFILLILCNLFLNVYKLKWLVIILFVGVFDVKVNVGVVWIVGVLFVLL